MAYKLYLNPVVFLRLTVAEREGTAVGPGVGGWREEGRVSPPLLGNISFQLSRCQGRVRPSPQDGGQSWIRNHGRGHGHPSLRHGNGGPGCGKGMEGALEVPSFT